jgi:hypothetical protein
MQLSMLSAALTYLANLYHVAYYTLPNMYIWAHTLLIARSTSNTGSRKDAREGQFHSSYGKACFESGKIARLEQITTVIVQMRLLVVENDGE